MIQWAMLELARRGKRVTGEPDIIHDRPWAQVARIPTDDGATFVKNVFPALGHEVPVTALLARIVPDHVTVVIAHDAYRRFLLMEDAGERLRAILERDRDLRHHRELLPRYAELQLQAAPHADGLVAAGAPDFRSSALPAAFEAVIATDELLTIAREHSATAEELAALRALVPHVREWNDALAGTIPESIQHDDLHDGQIFVRDGHVRFLDWGDANVSHPFFSLVVYERHIARNFELAPEGREMLALRDAYLEPFTAVATRAQIDAALRPGLVLGRLARALTWTYLVRALPMDERQREMSPGWFTVFLEAASAM